MLSAGDRLGPYEILTLLGTGGMGEVWKARDTRLNRFVAIKCLNVQHGARFEQEARAIAALNHSHICQIFDIGPDYLVLEFVEGVPLEGPLPVRDALQLAVQIASALEAAHKVRSLEEDPLNIYARVMFGAQLFASGRSLEGETAARQALERDPNSWLAYLWRGAHHATHARLAEACADLDKAYALAPWNVCVIGLYAGVLAVSGDRPRAEALLSGLGDGNGVRSAVRVHPVPWIARRDRSRGGMVYAGH